MSALQKPITLTSVTTNSTDSLFDKFNGRRSQELVVALAGPIGCGISSIGDELKERLRDRGYEEVVHIKLSDFLEEAINKGIVTELATSQKSKRFTRYRRLQEAGKALREKSNNPAILAEYAIQQIKISRKSRQRSTSTSDSDQTPPIPERTAYLIDQVKRPEEIRLLRAVYRNLFYFLGITRVNDKRSDELAKEGTTQSEAQELIEIDKDENSKNGQQLDKTLHLADYIIRNDATTVEDKRNKINRFLDLIHGNTSISPTDAEHGMYAAYAAGLRSACLSRQVGAAITSKTGEILATGCNDVPMASGGLYTSSRKGPDMRCIHMDGQSCFNDLHKRKLQGEIGEVIEKTLNELFNDSPPITREQQGQILERIYSDTRLKSLIEFSRSVHAEMDAIISLARIGGVGIESATLYTTTYPCHNCARHIVASGIMKVFYIEPYEKSLAKDLHKDAIAFEVEETIDKDPKRVEFLHYEGVSPHQFHHVFRAAGRKDKTGKFIPIKLRDAEKVLPEYIDNYQDFETKAVQHLTEEMQKLSSQAKN